MSHRFVHLYCDHSPKSPKMSKTGLSFSVDNMLTNLMNRQNCSNSSTRDNIVKLSKEESSHNDSAFVDVLADESPKNLNKFAVRQHFAQPFQLTNQQQQSTNQQQEQLKRKKATRITDPGFVSRKDRSLGLMCRQFLQCVQDESRTSGVVHIEKICGMLSELYYIWRT